MQTLYRLLIGSFLLGFITIQTQAQSQSQSTAPYIIFKTTYAFPAGSQKINENTITANNKTLTQGIYGSYGRGINLNLGVGKMLNPTFGVEMNAQVLLGNSINTAYSSDEDSSSGSYSARINGVLLKPFIVVRNSGDLLAIYTKFGLAIATVTNRYEKEELQYTIGGESNYLVAESTETAKAKVGLAACFGLSFRVSESVSLFVEANGQIMSLPVTKGHYTKYLNNGTDELASMPTNLKSWVYEKSIGNEPYDPSKPGAKLYEPANFSYVGIGVGFLYHF